LHWRITNVRGNALHQLSHRLTRDFGWIALEDLNVKGMLSNRNLARRLANAAFGELRRQLTYKAAQRGGLVAVVDCWYPSSKTCSSCGALKDVLTLGTRTWVCTGCGAVHDRDHNAAKNILAESIRTARLAKDQETAGAAGIVCGEEGAGAGRKACANRPR
jgi:putative transposase